MTDYLLDYNDIIVSAEYIPTLFKPITEKNIALLSCDISKINKLYDKNLRIYIYRLQDSNTDYSIEVHFIYKDTYQLYMSCSYNKIYDKCGIKNKYFTIGNLTYFTKDSRSIQILDSFQVMYLCYVEEILRNILNEINNIDIDINMTYYKFLTILKVVPIINEIYDKYKSIYQFLPKEIKNPNIFSIIADYI